jgi:hypothetical protein
VELGEEIEWSLLRLSGRNLPKALRFGVDANYRHEILNLLDFFICFFPLTDIGLKRERPVHRSESLLIGQVGDRER